MHLNESDLRDQFWTIWKLYLEKLELSSGHSDPEKDVTTALKCELERVFQSHLMLLKDSLNNNPLNQPSHHVSNTICA